MGTGPSSLALRLQACLRMVLCWGPGPPGPALRGQEPLARALALAWAGPGSCATEGTIGRAMIDNVSARGGNAASQRGGAGGEGSAFPGIPCAPVACGAGGGGEALLPLVPVPIVEVLVPPVV